MAVSWHEIAAIVIGLGGGYWLVGRVMDGRNASGPWPDVASNDAAQPWWEVLGVPRIATRDEIVRAYKVRISEYHPDKVAQMGDEIRAVAERRSKEINSAYDEALRELK